MKQDNNPLETTQDPRWAVLTTRDSRAEGTFFYSVATTGVYCRPGCPSRLPRPEHVRFHRTLAEAEAAGFRPCKRCKPREASLGEQYAQKIAAACRSIEQAEVEPCLGDLAAAAEMSRFHFHRVFRSATGLTPKQYATAQRMGHVRRHLRETRTVTEAVYEAGFGSNGRFYATANHALGMTPSVFRTGGQNANIHFAIGESRYGSVLVAQTERGICAILLGDAPEPLVRDLQDRFPHASLVGGDRAFEDVVANVVGLIESPQSHFDLPLDIQGTAFQQRVWQALRQIPVGSTASYTDIAHRIGSPQSVRAVAQACGANRLAVAIPCHRVVRTDGSLSGYRWGVERKRTLLGNEAALSPNAHVPDPAAHLHREDFTESDAFRDT